jgi:hypothetical protein
MNSLEKCKKIVHLILKINDEPLLNNGISEQLIKDQLSKYGLEGSDEIISLYSWRNGIYNINAFVSFLSLTDALSTYDIYKKIKDTNNHFPWNAGLFPIIDSNGDTQVCIDLNSKKLVAIDLECETFIDIAIDYEDYLDCIIKILETNMFRYCEIAGEITIPSNNWEHLSKEFSVKSI